MYSISGRLVVAEITEITQRQRKSTSKRFIPSFFGSRERGRKKKKGIELEGLGYCELKISDSGIFFHGSLREDEVRDFLNPWNYDPAMK